MKTLENKSMHFDHEKPLQRGQAYRTAALRTGVLLFLIIGGIGMAREIFALHGLQVWGLTLLCGIVPGGLMLLAMKTRGRSAWMAVAIPAVMLLLCLIFARRLWSSLALMMNRILEQVQLRSLLMMLPFDVGDASPLLGQMFTAAASSVLAALLVLYAGGFGWLLCFAVWAAAGTAYLKADLWLVLFSLGCALLPLTSQRCKSKRAGLQTAAMVLALTVPVIAVVLLYGWNEKIDLSGLRTDVTATAHRLRYESAQQAMPEGNFSAGTTLHYSGDNMLEIRMDTPDSLYLRGMTCAVYGADGWSPVEREAAVLEAERVYWLEKNGFSGETQLSALADALEYDALPLQMDITVAGACRENLYLPPETTAFEPLESGSLRDGTVHASGISGKLRYTVSARTNLIVCADELLDLLEERQSVPKVAEYLRLEENYRTFVYKTYLDIPQDCAAILHTVYGLDGQPGASYDARTLVRNVLDGCANYGKNAKFSGGGSTLLSDLLDGKPANSAQYATAAVLMLRTLGIPARYAEGYLIAPDRASGTVDGTAIMLSGRDAHAWAEYYEDGVGWIPFETVPEYVELMEEAGWRHFRLDEDALLETDSEQMETDEPEESPAPETEPEAGDASQWDNRELLNADDRADAWILRLLWLLLILLLLAALCMIVRRKKILQRRAAEFENPDVSAAIGALFAYSMELMQHSGLQRNNMPLSWQIAGVEQWFGAENAFAEMQALNEEALFSNHSFAETQRSEMKAFADQTLARFKVKLSRGKRWYQQWICCMY